MRARFPAPALWTAVLAEPALACGACRPSVWALVFTPEFPSRIAAMLAPVLIVLAIGAIAHVQKEKTHAPP